ncbi:MAG: hypothetical protein KJO07_05195 [Deltaproteobacteria bacterium]|nr:hypothetical protein [Deltaproteobacteria bacterium]
MGKNRATICSLAITAMLACGDDDGDTGNRPDGAPSADANTTDAAPATAACGIDLPDGAPGVFTVVFSDPDGATLAEVSSDAEGLATYDDCGEDTTVTVAFQAPGGSVSDYNLWVYTGVQPGTTILFPQGDSPELTASATVTLATPAPAPSNGYTAFTGCYENGEPAVVGSETTLGSQTAGCGGNDQTNLDVLVVADQNGAIAGFDYGTATVDATVTAFGTLDGWEDPTSASVEITNVPSTVVAVDLSVGHLRDGIQLYDNDVSPAVAPGTVSGTVDDLPPAGFADQIANGAFAVFEQGGAVGLRRVVAPATSLSLDFADFLPRLSGILLSSPEPSRPRVTWAADGDLSPADLGFVYYQWTDTGDATHSVRMVLHDAAAGSAQLPALPDSLSAYRPTADDILSPAIGFFAESTEREYADFLTGGRLALTLLPDRIGLLFRGDEEGALTTNITPD